jgi:hypothetical protein
MEHIPSPRMALLYQSNLPIAFSILETACMGFSTEQQLLSEAHQLARRSESPTSNLAVLLALKG